MKELIKLLNNKDEWMVIIKITILFIITIWICLFAPIIIIKKCNLKEQEIELEKYKIEMQIKYNNIKLEE